MIVNDMPVDPIDRRAYIEFLLWYALTASKSPSTEPRVKVARRYFGARGYRI
jgi:hypothetical protein